MWEPDARSHVEAVILSCPFCASALDGLEERRCINGSLNQRNGSGDRVDGIGSRDTGEVKWMGIADGFDMSERARAVEDDVRFLAWEPRSSSSP